MNKIRLNFIIGLVSLFFLSSISFAQTKKDTSLLVKIDRNGPKYGADSNECIIQLSLYREYYRNYTRTKEPQYLNDALKPWRWVFANCPMSTQNLYIDGAVIYKHRIGKEKNKAVKDKLVDTLMLIYDRRIEAFGREGYVLGRKGADHMQYRPSEIEKTYKIFNDAFELEKNKTESAVLYYYFTTTIEMVEKSKLDTAAIVEVYDKVSSAAEYNISKGGKSQKNFEGALSNIETIAGRWLNCKDIIRIYSLKFKETPNDLELLKKITNLLDKKDCTDSDLFFKALTNRNKLEPSAETAYLLGKLNAKKELYAEAVKYLNEAISLYDDSLKKANAYYLLGNVNLAMKQYSTARTNALKGLAITPKDGRFYIIIGNAYAQSASSCGDNELTSQVAYWAAVDKFNQAKQVDNSEDIINIANSLINSYSKHFPDQSTVFFYTLKEGDSYLVECWINEKTTVRIRK
ncbi:MAG: tetratricopeptide repeat protein [Saprospiraceae bacterium]|nr:tetratricopeptide repeat protein [Saprospiraceae bacterium]